MQKKILLPTLLCWLLLGLTDVFPQANRYSEIDWSNIDPSTNAASDLIVLNSGEKVFGTIHRNYDRVNYSEIRFQSGGQIKTYRPEDLKGFGLDNGQLFFSRQLPGQSELFFVQILVSGSLELSEYRGSLFLDDGNTYHKLDSYQRQIEVDGKTRSKTYKPYIYLLKTALTGDCAVLLYPKIDRLPYNQERIIRLLEEYFVCQATPYTIHVERVPLVRFSPTLGVGISHFSLSPGERLEGRNDQFDNNLGYQGFVGIRLHDLRSMPRLSMDLRLGYSTFSTTVLSSSEGPQTVWTSSEEVKETAFYVPLSVNYSVLKNQQSELYIGISGGLWIKKVETSGGIIDLKNVSTRDTKLYEDEIVKILNSVFIPGLKVGYTMAFSPKLKLMMELEANMQQEYYRFEVFQNKPEYSRGRLSFQVGLEF